MSSGPRGAQRACSVSSVGCGTLAVDACPAVSASAPTPTGRFRMLGRLRSVVGQRVEPLLDVAPAESNVSADRVAARSAALGAPVVDRANWDVQLLGKLLDAEPFPGTTSGRRGGRCRQREQQGQ